MTPHHETPGRDGCTVTRIPLQQGRSAGVELLELDNGRLRVAVVPQRGMGIWKAWLGDALEIGWQSPVRGPVHPAFVMLDDAGGIGWLDGFDELLCRCGLSANGAPDVDGHGRVKHSLHGRIANLPAEDVHIERDGTGALTITGTVYETRVHHQKLRLRATLTSRPGEAGFSIRDEVTNLSAQPTTVQLLYHYNLGAPLLGPGATVHAPVHRLVPRNARAAEGVERWNICEGPSAGFEEQVYFATLHADEAGRTLALLKSADGTRGASVRFDPRQLPCFVLWKNCAAMQDGYVAGLEPGTNFPNPNSFESAQGRVVRLAGGERATFDLAFRFYDDPAEVIEAEREIEAIARGRERAICSKPQSGWCA
jgi:hypothetical protein